MNNFINGLNSDGIITINRVILKEGYTVDDLEERVAYLCENVKVHHSTTGFVGGFVCLNKGNISNAGSTTGKAVDNEMKDKEALIITFWNGAEINGEKVDAFTAHEQSHLSTTFQPLFERVLEISESAEEPVYELLWSGAKYSEEDAKKALEAKEKFGG